VKNPQKLPTVFSPGILNDTVCA